MNATETKTYRGRTLEEVLPKIKAELGPDAEIVRQRSGLTGGVGGFFQRQMVEVEARAPDGGPRTADGGEQGRRFDAYDDAPAVPELLTPAPESEVSSFVPDTPTADGLSAPGIQEIIRQAAPFAEALGHAERRLDPEPEADAPRSPLPAPHEPPVAAAKIETQLTDAGIDPATARDVGAEVVSHELTLA